MWGGGGGGGQEVERRIRVNGRFRLIVTESRERSGGKTKFRFFCLLCDKLRAPETRTYLLGVG